MKNKISIITFLLVLGCYVIVVSLLSPGGMSFYISLVFTLIAAGIQVMCVGKLFTERNVNEYFYRFPVIRAGACYMVIQFITGAILSIKDTGVKITIIIEVIILGVLGSWELWSLYEGQRAKDIQENHQVKILDYRKLQSKAKQIVSQTTDFEWRQKANAVYEAVSFMNPVSSVDSFETDMDILDELNQIEEAIVAQDRTKYEKKLSRIRILVSQRN